MRLRMYGATDQGLVRTSNQDAYFCSAEYGLVIVSDGMGGHKGGEIASQMVVNGLRDAYVGTAQILVENVGPFLDDVLRRINLEILDLSQKDENLRGMGATVNYLQFAGGHVAIGHAGDSRTYLIRAFRQKEGRARHGIWNLTIDHNVGTFVERGLLVPGRDIPPGPLTEKQKSRLMRGMGVVSDLKADLYCKAISDGDVYLTCSDGLHGFVSDRDILRAVTSGPISHAPERLIEVAKQVGAPDNVTVVLSIVSDVEEPLRDVAGNVEEQKPYLVRFPSGELRGIYPAIRIIEEWLRSDIPNNAEVCSSLDKWVFLHNREQLFQTYPEFNTAQVREHYKYLAPDSSIEHAIMQKQASAVRTRKLRMILTVLATAALLTAIGHFVVSEFLNTLLPAY